MINFYDSNLFTPVTHPESGVTIHVLTRRVAPVQQGFYFVNDSMSADGRYLWFYCAFPPAQHYSESPYGVGYSKLGNANREDHADIPDGAHYLPPHNILAFNDYEKWLAYAKKVQKPVMIDFTGHACVNC